MGDKAVVDKLTKWRKLVPSEAEGLRLQHEDTKSVGCVYSIRRLLLEWAVVYISLAYVKRRSDPELCEGEETPSEPSVGLCLIRALIRLYTDKL